MSRLLSSSSHLLSGCPLNSYVRSTSTPLPAVDSTLHTLRGTLVTLGLLQSSMGIGMKERLEKESTLHTLRDTCHICTGGEQQHCWHERERERKKKSQSALHTLRGSLDTLGLLQISIILMKDRKKSYMKIQWSRALSFLLIQCFSSHGLGPTRWVASLFQEGCVAPSLAAVANTEQSCQAGCDAGGREDGALP